MRKKTTEATEAEKILEILEMLERGLKNLNNAQKKLDEVVSGNNDPRLEKAKDHLYNSRVDGCSSKLVILQFVLMKMEEFKDDDNVREME